MEQRRHGLLPHKTLEHAGIPPLALDLTWSIAKGALKAEAADELLKRLAEDPEPEVATAAK
jgi:hypothetical protein